jgi:hypothetical protein
MDKVREQVNDMDRDQNTWMETTANSVNNLADNMVPMICSLKHWCYIAHVMFWIQNKISDDLTEIKEALGSMTSGENYPIATAVEANITVRDRFGAGPAAAAGGGSSSRDGSRNFSLLSQESTETDGNTCRIHVNLWILFIEYDCLGSESTRLSERDTEIVKLRNSLSNVVVLVNQAKETAAVENKKLNDRISLLTTRLSKYEPGVLSGDGGKYVNGSQ